MLVHHHSQPAKPARVVVIGAGGFVGGAIVRRLGVERAPMLALTRAEVDLLAPDAAARLQALLRPDDSVVMVSGIAPAKTVAMLMQNLRMAEALAASLAAQPVAHLLYVSSDAVYADDANPVTEGSPLAPSTLHGLMHAAREMMLRTACGATPFAALRPTLIYGAADPHNGYGPNRFRRQAAKGEPIAIFGEGEEKRDHVHVDDVARLAALIIAHRSSGALNAATGIATSFHDIARMVAGQFPGATIASQPRLGPRPHLLHRFFDITGCYKSFPTFRYTKLGEGLARALETEGKDMTPWPR